MRGALLRYRIMAWTTGTALLILCFVGIPIQVWGHNNGVVEVFGPIHGFLFLVYLLAALDISVRARFSPIKTVLVLASGTIPFASFVAEHVIAKQYADIMHPPVAAAEDHVGTHSDTEMDSDVDTDADAAPPA
jgi:integral membrane protein